MPQARRSSHVQGPATDERCPFDDENEYAEVFGELEGYGSCLPFQADDCACENRGELGKSFVYQLEVFCTEANEEKRKEIALLPACKRGSTGNEQAQE
jgi:hypothetical protein